MNQKTSIKAGKRLNLLHGKTDVEKMTAKSQQWLTKFDTLEAQQERTKGALQAIITLCVYASDDCDIKASELGHLLEMLEVGLS